MGATAKQPTNIYCINKYTDGERRIKDGENDNILLDKRAEGDYEMAFHIINWVG